MTVYVALVRGTAGHFVLLNQENNIHAFPTERAGLAHFESSYQRAHGRDWTWSMSAAVHWLTFQVSIVPIEGVHTVVAWAGGGPDLRVVSYAGDAGRMVGLPIPDDVAAPIWEAGAKPALTNRAMGQDQGACA